jgi:acyl-CoA synthetase (AMP-forming)/AMP-acid ligase II
MYITQGLHRSLQRAPASLATVFGPRRRTVREHVDRVARLAGALRRLGLEEGDRVGVLALNSDRFAEVLMAVPWAGGVLTPFSIRWGPAEMANALTDSAPHALLVDDAFAQHVPALLDADPGLDVVVHMGDGVPPEGMAGYEDLLAGSEPVEDLRRGDDATAALMYTGGTSGLPKGVMLTHAALCEALLSIEATTPSRLGDARVLVATPMSHMSGLVSALLQTTYGGTQVIVPAFDAGEVIETIERERVTHIFLVPSMLQAVLDHPALADHDVSSMRRFIYGAAPITDALLHRAMTAFPTAELMQVYASTEMGAAGTVLRPEDHAARRALRSAGQAMANTEIRVVDSVGEQLPTGRTGEITVRGSLMAGYWNKPVETRTALRDGWLHTGDAGYLDAGGYLHIVDRVRDMIVTGGDNVYSVEVENALVSHPAVASCAVIAVPDDALGERVHAVVVLEPGAATDLEDLRAHCSGLLADYKLPRSGEFVDALPLSAAGKPLKKELRRAHWADMERQVH